LSTCKGEINNRLCGLRRVASPLILRRDAVSDLRDSIGIGRIGESAQPDHGVIDLVYDGETEFPRVRLGSGTKLRDKIRRCSQQIVSHTMRDANSERFFIFVGVL
jgi:hypothetical protein